MKYNPTNTTLQRKPTEIGISKTLRFNWVRTNAVCPATNIIIITQRKLIQGLFHKKRYFKYMPMKNSWIIIRIVPITAGFSNPVLNFHK